MAAPGFSVSELISACLFIYKTCVNYKDAKGVFQELSSEALSISTALKHLEVEVRKPNFDQATILEFKIVLQGLKKVVNRLVAIIEEYQDMNKLQRLMFSFNEMQDLPKLRAELVARAVPLQVWVSALHFGCSQEILRIVQELKAQDSEIDYTFLASMVATGNIENPGTVPKVLVTPGPDKKPAIDKKALRKISSDSSLTDAKTLLPSPQQPQRSLSDAGGKKKSKKARKENARILVVDGADKARSVTAQTYLHLIRAATANTTGRWLFKEADSAGHWVKSDFLEKNQDVIQHPLEAPKKGPPSPELAALIDQPHFRSREKDDIIARVRDRSTQGITDSHFIHFDYILCFDASTEWTLHELKKRVQIAAPDTIQKSQIIRLPGVGWSKTRNNDETVTALKKAIRQWLQDELGWDKPAKYPPIKSGPWRTKEIVIWERNIGAVMGVKGERIEKIREASNCKIRITDRRPHQGRLVSITGKKDDLPKAEAMLRECWTSTG